MARYACCMILNEILSGPGADFVELVKIALLISSCSRLGHFQARLGLYSVQSGGSVIGGFGNREEISTLLFSSKFKAILSVLFSLYFIIGIRSTLLYLVYWNALYTSFPLAFSRNESHRVCLAVFIDEK